MIVDLGPLPYRKAMELVRWCAEHDVDRDRALFFIESWADPNSKMIKDDEWYLDVPDKYMTYFALKWIGQGL